MDPVSLRDQYLQNPELRRQFINPIMGLGGGVVTSRHASLLSGGELVRADDSRYRPNDPGLWRAWGRTKYITSNGQVAGTSGKIVGVAFCPFDPAVDGLSDNFLVALRASTYYVSVFTGRTGQISGTTFPNVGAGTHLDACHAGNKWYLFNGNGDGVANQVFKPNQGAPISRRHGLVPVPITPTSPTVSVVAGTWPRDDTFWGEGRYFFFTTEAVAPGDPDELESAISLGEPPHVDLAKDINGAILFDVIVTRHQFLANSNATEVRFYMVKASLSQAWDTSLLATAFRVGTTSVSATYTNDKIRLSGNYAFADPTTNPTVTVLSGTINNPSFITAGADGVVATVPTGLSAIIDLTNWGFSVSAGATVTGLKMFIRYRKSNNTSGPAIIGGTFRYGAGPTVGISKQFTMNSHNFVLQQQPNPNSETDTWGLTITGADVNASTFGVRLSINAIGGEISIDQVTIRVYTGSLPSIGPAYPIIALQQDNVLVVHHANTPPPIADTGDVIDGAMVINDSGNQRTLAYSLPTKYDYYPAIYRIAIDGGVHDKVMGVRRLGDVGLVLMEQQIVRLNYVPYSTDPEFITGRCYEAIVPDHGCASRQGFVLFQLSGDSTCIAYVSHNGVYMNDGNRDRILTEDADWSAAVDVTQLDKAVLQNYPKEFVLVLHYIKAGSGATENNAYMLIHYHPSHRKSDGNRKLTWPNAMNAACGCLAKLGVQNVLITGHNSDGRLYVEDNDVSDASGVGINMLFETGEIYPVGQGRECTIVRSWVHHNGGAAGMTMTFTPRFRNTAQPLTDTPAQTFAPAVEGLVLLQTHFGTAEAVRYRCSLPDAGANNAAIAFNYIVHQFTEGAEALNN